MLHLNTNALWLVKIVMWLVTYNQRVLFQLKFVYDPKNVTSFDV